jgi:pimeloyl-ACP methyl ester carboxylesterase
MSGASEPVQFLPPAGGRSLAFRRLAGRKPGVFFLGGFHSDMTGTKAAALAAHCRAVGRAFVRFDYTGHGASSGRFEEGTIGGWLADALRVLDEAAEGPQVLVGSSMGGWIMLLAALARPERVRGLVGVAAAPDFTEELVWERLPEEDRRRLREEGFFVRPSRYDGKPYPVTRRLIEEGRAHLLLKGPIGVRCPVRLIHGMADGDVPWEVSLRLCGCLSGADVELTLVKGGDHRLSSPEDIRRLTETAEGLCRRVEEESG